MTIQMLLQNELGTFTSEKMEISKEQYLELIEISKKFYTEDTGFEMWIDDGFVIVPPEITRKSILTISIIQYDDDEE